MPFLKSSWNVRISSKEPDTLNKSVLQFPDKDVAKENSPHGRDSTKK